MIYIRTRYLCACLAASDTTIVAGGVPLQRYSWDLVHSGSGDVHAIGLALAANLALLMLALCGLGAAVILTRRGAWFLIRRYAAAFAQANSVLRTRTRL